MIKIGLDNLPDEILIIIFKLILPDLQFEKTVKLSEFQNIWNDPEKKIIKLLFNLSFSSKKIKKVLNSKEFDLWKKIYYYHFRCFKVINPLSNANAYNRTIWFNFNHKILLDNNLYVYRKPYWNECGYKLFTKFLKYGIENNSDFIMDAKFGDVLRQSLIWSNYINYQNIVHNYAILKTKQMYFDEVEKLFVYPHPLDCENTFYSFTNYLKIAKYDLEQISRVIYIKNEDMYNKKECLCKKNYCLIESLDDGSSKYNTQFPQTINSNFGLINLLLQIIENKEMTSSEILESKCISLYYKIGNPCFNVEHFSDDCKSVVCVDNDNSNFDFQVEQEYKLNNYKCNNEDNSDNINYKKLFISNRVEFLRKKLNISEWKKLSPIWDETNLVNCGSNGRNGVSKCSYKTTWLNNSKLNNNFNGLNLSNCFGYSSSEMGDYFRHIKKTIKSEKNLKPLTYYESQKKFHLKMINEIEKEEEKLKRKASQLMNEAYLLNNI